MAILAILYLGLMAAFTMGATVAALFGRRRAEQASILSVLSVSLDRRLPLAEEIDALADSFRLKQQAALLTVSDLLRQGERLDRALESVPPLIAPESLLAIRAGAALELLPDAVRQEAQRMTDPARLRRPIFESLEGWFVYVFGIALVIVTIITFLMISIIPKFKKIFEDFGAELPGATILGLDIAGVVASFGAPLAALLFLVNGYVIWTAIFSRSGWKAVDPPLLRGWLRRFDAPEVLRICALQVRAQRPLVEVLDVMKDLIPRRSSARAMWMAWRRVADGNECWAELASAGFLTRAEADVLRAAERSRNLSWALEALSDAMERRRHDRLRVARELLPPLVVIPLGIVVFVIVTACFLPLVKLINDVS